MHDRTSRRRGHGALTSALALLALALGAQTAAADEQTLGPAPRQPLAAKPAIVGGTPISVAQAPWQVFLYSTLPGGRTYACGGSILDASRIVTAGHCVYNSATATPVAAADLTVVAGISNTRAPEATRQPRSVTQVRIHPGYTYTAQNAGVAPADVAVLTLSAPLNLSGAAAKPIPLIAAGAYPAVGTAAGITGFGRQAAGGTPDGRLYAVGTTIGDPLACGGEANAVVDCISSPAGSACEGDSGGPLTIGAALAGVASFVATTGPTGECGVGSVNGYANLAAPEIRDFVLGSDNPPVAPRGGQGVSARGQFLAGGSMTCQPGVWSGSPTYTYTFVDTRNGQVLQSSPSDTYVFGDGDVGRTVACQPAATNAGGTAITRTQASQPIGARPPAPKPVARPRLRLAVRGSTGRVRRGGTVRWAITVSNRGRAGATGVTVCAAPGRGFAFAALPRGARRSRGRACFSLRTVKAGKRRTVRVTMRAARGARTGLVRSTFSLRSGNGGSVAGRVGVRIVRR
jgi:uncharacterized repeat protein (TIGR01451 family)